MAGLERACMFCQIARSSTTTTLLHNDNSVVAFQDIKPAAFSLELAGLLLLLFVTLMESLVQLHEHNYENEKNVDDDKIRPWVDLPSELLNLIFSSLFDPDHISFSSIRDQFRFRLTSKGWQSKVPCLLGQFPFLMSRPPRYIGGAFTFFNPITNKEIQVFDEDDMEVVPGLNLRIHCSRFGWLLMSDGYFLFLYNPFIPGSTIELPYAPIPHLNASSMSFTAPPTSSDCIVYVHCMYDPDHGVGIYRWCYGEDDWTDYHIDCQLPFGQSCGNPIFYGSVFYQLNKCGRLGISDPKKGNEQHIWKDLPRPKPLKNIYSPPYGTTNKRKRRQQPKAAQEDIIIQSKPPLEIRTKHYMAECDGKLVMVRVDYRGCFLVHSLHVFELDWSRMEWVTVKSLGNKTMFIGEAGSLLTKTNGGGAENKIYFPAYVNTEDEDGDGDATKKVGAFYCLENHKYNFPPVKWKRVMNCTWIDTKFQL